MISLGATSLATNSWSFLTQKSDLTPLLAPGLTLTGLVWSNGTVTATTQNPIAGLTSSETFTTTISGASPAAYNGTVVATVTGANTFTYALASNPGSATSFGTYTPGNQVELNQMATTLFAQGSTVGAYVLELGALDATGGANALSTWLTNNPGQFFSFLVPRNWDGNAAFLSLVNQYTSPTAMVYFFTTTTTGTYTDYSASQKCVFAGVEAPTVSATGSEFTMAADFRNSLAYNPSSTNLMTPFGNSYVFGVTAYPAKGNNSLLTTLSNANINYVATGAEGGQPSTTLIWKGNTLDGNDFTYWFSVAWIQIFGQQSLALAVENGSNNPLAPLWYDQAGINTLQDVLATTVTNAVSFKLASGGITKTALDPTTFAQNFQNGLYAGQNVVNAVPWVTYTQQNQANWKAGIYGLGLVYLPSRPFKQILLNITVSNLVSP